MKDETQTVRKLRLSKETLRRLEPSSAGYRWTKPITDTCPNLGVTCPCPDP